MRRKGIAWHFLILLVIAVVFGLALMVVMNEGILNTVSNAMTPLAD